MAQTLDGRLAGHIAVVTGSTAGMGREIATVFAREGARVVVTGRDATRGEAVVADIVAAGGAASFRAANLEHEGDCDDLIDWTVEEFGVVTVLVNNAATSESSDSAVHDMITDSWEQILRVDLTAAAWMCRAAIGAMLDADRGAIVNISSRAGLQGIPAHAAYSAAKGGLDSLTAIDRGRLRPARTSDATPSRRVTC